MTVIIIINIIHSSLPMAAQNSTHLIAPSCIPTVCSAAVLKSMLETE